MWIQGEGYAQDQLIVMQFHCIVVFLSSADLGTLQMY